MRREKEKKMAALLMAFLINRIDGTRARKAVPAFTCMVIVFTHAN